MTKAKAKVAKGASPRPFRTHYPGMLRTGYCVTARSAAEAAYRHLARGEERRATVEGSEGEVVWLTWTPMGIMTTFAPKLRAELRPRADLRRVK